MRRATSSPSPARYPKLGGPLSRVQKTSAMIGLISGLMLVLVYRWYLTTGDIAPDSTMGLTFAVLATTLLVMISAGYVIRKRVHRPWPLRLHTALSWHIVGGLISLVLLFMHAAGNFNPRSGTYALYGVIAVVVSGVVGRALDRICPRIAADSALSSLGLDSEGRIRALEEHLSASSAHLPKPTRRVHQPAEASLWDLAYHDLSAQTGEVPAIVAQQLRTPRTKPEPQTVKLQVQAEASHLQRMIGYQRFLVHAIHVWRRVHQGLTIVTLGLILWHIGYAMMLMM